MLQVAAVQRHFLDGPVLYTVREIRGSGFEQLRLGDDLHHFLGRPDLQLGIHLRQLAGRDVNIHDVSRIEPRRCDMDAVFARHQVHYPVISRAVGLGRRRNVRVYSRDGNVGTRDYGALRVRDNALHYGAV